MLNVVQLLQKLVRCPSVTPEDAGVIELTKQVLLDIGFEVEIIEFTDYSTYPVYNIYARLGNGDSTIAFCGHLDVVPPGDTKSWTVDPFSAEIKEGYIIGRGAEDMKGGVAAFISSVSTLSSNFDKSKHSIVILLTLDEEKLAINGIAKLIDYVVNNKKLNIEACLVGEPTCKKQVGDCVKIGRRGSLNFNITVTGKQGHVAYNGLFDNPIYSANKIVSNLLNIDLYKTANNFNLSNLEITGLNTSSSVYNIVPKDITIIGNVRFNPAYTLREIKSCINLATKEYSDAEVSFLPDCSEAFITNNLQVCDMLTQSIKEVTNIDALKDTSGGTSDARFISKYTNVIEFGLVEKTLHQIDEKVSIKDLQTLTEIYKTFLTKYLASGKFD